MLLIYKYFFFDMSRFGDDVGTRPQTPHSFGDDVGTRIAVSTDGAPAPWAKGPGANNRPKIYKQSVSTRQIAS